MDEFGSWIYIAFIVISILSGVLKSSKRSDEKTKKHVPKKTPAPEEKSFEEIWREITESKIPAPKPVIQPVEEIEESLESVTTGSLEVMIDETSLQNKSIQIQKEPAQDTEKQALENTDWRQAVILSEVLGRPKSWT
jgi:hypothetical protein